MKFPCYFISFYSIFTCRTLAANFPIPGMDSFPLTESVSFDKRGVPERVYFWNKVEAGSYTNSAGQVILNAFACQYPFSTNNAAVGTCETALLPFSSSLQGYGDIKVAIYLKRKMPMYYSDTWRLVTRATRYTPSGSTMPWAIVMAPKTETKPTNLLEVFLDKTELSKLPVGTFHFFLALGQYQCKSLSDDNCQLIDVWTKHISISVTDTGTQTIFFPSSPASSPVVNLNLNAAGSPGMSTVSGQNSIDMCLYDGSNSSSNRISLLLQDEGAPSTGRPAGQFSVYRDGADKTSPANRIDHAVSVINPTTGAIQTVQNGNEIIWTNTNARNILRRVSLPGVPGSSLCVPAPLTLTTPQFRLSDKSSGHYSGKLRIVYTPTTQTGS